MRKESKNYTAEERVAILRRHLIDKVSVSTLCEELQLQPTLFYHWLKQFFENGAAAFQRQPHSGQRREWALYKAIYVEAATHRLVCQLSAELNVGASSPIFTDLPQSDCIFT